MSRANGFLSAVMQLSMGMGVAVGAITLRLVAHAHGHSAAVPQLRDFHVAILLMAILSLGPVFDSLGLPPDAGATTSGHRQRGAGSESRLIPRYHVWETAGLGRFTDKRAMPER